MHTAIYLDYNATTPCDPRVIEAMLPFFGEIYGNPSNGLHPQGRLAAKHVEEARAHVAAVIGASPGEIIFTAGATESNNLAIVGVARATRSGRRRIVTSAVEHKSALLPCQRLADEGFEVVILPVDRFGRVAVEAIDQAVDDTTLLVSIQSANNETGTLQPIAEIAEIAHQRGALVHCDSAQAIGKVPVDVELWGVDLLSISAHKLYGPKGVGALYVRSDPYRVPLAPIMVGGGQEKSLRPGTLNVPAIVGFGEACRLSLELLPEESMRVAALRDALERQLREGIPALQINGDPERRLPNTSSLTFPGVEADALILNVPELMLGTGSACNAGAIEPSHVLQALGLSREEASRTVRVSLGRFTTEEQIVIAAREIIAGCRHLAHTDY